DPPPEVVAFWRDLSGEHLHLHLGSVALPAVLVTCRPEDRWIGTSHWLELTVPPGVRHRLTEYRKPAYFEVNYRDYAHQSHNPDGGQAGRGGDQGAGCLLRRLGRQRRTRQRPIGLVPHAEGRLVQRRRCLRRQLRHPRRPDLRLPAPLDRQIVVDRPEPV